jgi:hypothetical protein
MISRQPITRMQYSAIQRSLEALNHNQVQNQKALVLTF